MDLDGGIKKAPDADAGVKKSVADDGLPVKKQGSPSSKKAKNKNGKAFEKGEKAAKKKLPKVVTKIDWDLIRKYIRHLEDITGRKLHPKQIKELKKALRNKEYKRISPEKIIDKRKKFNNKKNSLIEQWEKKTGQKWPTYDKDIRNKNGKIIRSKGESYDAHHIIENSYDGPYEWWNIHPARFPNEHQGGIHGKGTPSRDIFK